MKVRTNAKCRKVGTLLFTTRKPRCYRAVWKHVAKQIPNGVTAFEGIMLICNMNSQVNFSWKDLFSIKEVPNKPIWCSKTTDSALVVALLQKYVWHALYMTKLITCHTVYVVVHLTFVFGLEICCYTLRYPKTKANRIYTKNQLNYKQKHKV